MREGLSRNRTAYGAAARSRRRLLVGVTLVAALVLAAAGVYWLGARAPADAPAAGRDTPAAETPETEPERAAAPPASVAREAPEPAPRMPLPALEESDAEIRGALTEIVGPAALETWLEPERVIGNLVVTIDNLPRPDLALEQRPFAPAPGELVVSGGEDAPVLDPANFGRYAEFVELVGALEATAVVALYRRYEPLFDEAYRELGYPDADFTPRLVDVIDHMLAAPAPEPPVRLAQPEVMYEFADEQLESASAGHKLMIRMGPDNARVIKSQLRELRAALAGAPGARGADE